MEHCHCSMCRKAQGASFVTWIDLPTSALRITSGEAQIRRYESSPGASRSFCTACGAGLFWQRAGSPVVSVAAGTLDGDPGCRPRGHIYVASRAPWVTLDDELEQFAASRPRPAE